VNRIWVFAFLVIACVLALSVAVTAVTGDQSVHTGAIGSLPTAPHWWTLWAVPPVETCGIALVSLYVLPRAAAGWHRSAGIAGIVVLLIAVCSPVAGLAHDGLLEYHMLQHTLIGGFGAMLVLAALPRATGPVTAIWRLVSNPLVGFPLWVASTAFWLWPALHDQLLSSDALWITQQVSFFVFGILVWCPVLERFAPAPSWFGTGWKCGYMTAVWFYGLLVANVFWFTGTPLYPGHAALDAAWGVGALPDQANAGTVMMVTHCILAFGTIGVLFFASAREQDLQQRLIEAGLDPDEVRTAVRAGQGNALAMRVGITTVSRPGID
jgi:cytochrome c oxidase assembly factor CtaG